MTPNKQKILILVFNSLKDDVRVKRQIRALKVNYDITAVCYESYEESEVDFLLVPPKPVTLLKKILVLLPLALNRYALAHQLLFGDKQLVKKIRQQKFDLVLSNDVETLPLAFSLNNPKVVFDAHEFAPRHFEDRVLWRWFYAGLNNYICKTYLPRLSGMMTVGYGLSKEYNKSFGVDSVVVTNADNFVSLEPSPVQENKIRLVHHGIANPSRKLEGMIDMLQFLDNRFTLDLILLAPRFATGKTSYYLDELKAKYADNIRVRILPPVNSDAIVATIHQYDIGVFLLPPTNFNYENALPNKLFNFIQARLGIAVGPTPEMAEIVHRYNLGVVSKEFNPESLAQELNKITTEQLKQFKINAQLAAQELNAEKNQVLINNLIKSALAKT